MLGKRLGLRIEDDESILGEEALERLVADPRVVAVIGPTSSTSAHRVALAAEGHGIGVVSASATSSYWNDDDPEELLPPGIFFRTVPPDRYLANGAAERNPALAMAARAIGAPERATATFLKLDNEDGRSFGALVSFFFQVQRGPFDWVPRSASYEQAFNYTDEDLVRKTRELLDGEPEVLYFATLAADGARFTHEIAKQLTPGYKPTLMGNWPHALPAFAAAAEPALIEGMVGVAPRQPASDPNLAAYVTAFRAAHGADPPLLSEGAYDAAYLIAYALARAGAADRDAVRAGLRAVSGPPGQRVGPGQWAAGLAALRAAGDVDYDGAAGPIDWGERGEVTFTRAPPAYVVYELRGGQLEIVEEVAAAAQP